MIAPTIASCGENGTSWTWCQMHRAYYRASLFSLVGNCSRLGFKSGFDTKKKRRNVAAGAGEKRKEKVYVTPRSRSEAHVTYSNRGSGVLTDLGCRTVYESCMGLGRTLNVAFSSSWKELRSLMSTFSPSVSLPATTVRLVGLDHLCRGQESAHSVRVSDSTCC